MFSTVGQQVLADRWAVFEREVPGLIRITCRDTVLNCQHIVEVESNLALATTRQLIRMKTGSSAVYADHPKCCWALLKGNGHSRTDVGDGSRSHGRRQRPRQPTVKR
jgi:hypothetical protein